MRIGDVEVQILQQQIAYFVRVWVYAQRRGSAGFPIQSYIDLNPADFPTEERLMHQVGVAAGAIAEEHAEKYALNLNAKPGDDFPAKTLDPAEAYKLAREAFKEEARAVASQKKTVIH